VRVDNSLTDAVMESIDLDPRIPDSLEIAVAANHGIVTLRGTVEKFGQRRAAAEDARRSKASTRSTTGSG